jgi:hypothetical protein
MENNETIEDLAETPDEEHTGPMPTGVKISLGGWLGLWGVGGAQVATKAAFGADIPGGNYLALGCVAAFFLGITYHTMDKYVVPWIKERKHKPEYCANY